MSRIRVPGPRRSALLRGARQALRGLVRCPLCQRSGGHMLDGHEVCSKCRAELAPTQFELWRRTLNLTVKEIAQHAGVTPMTIHRTLRGQPCGAVLAAKLSALSSVPAEVLEEGEPSPFRVRDA